MKRLKSYEIRQMWLDFWKEKGHVVFPSASLIPVNDPTLLWINAGVAPLKKYFDGRLIPTNRRICNAQKAIRTNDIENVGKTARHHTFFEMLGNFSIGDYFRKEALTWAFEILTSEKWFAFDLNKLYFTVYTNDYESINIWKSLGVKEDHIIPLDGNFWEIGDGPCGPDSEIFYDRGEKYDKDNLGIKLLKEDISNDRYIEIWNVVFSQYNAESKVSRENYKELPSKNIDTGMGLERMACIMQEAETNYETDLFMPLINKIEEMTGVKYNGQMAFKVICDHIRSVTFALSDGASLSNEGRGYVLRRILRRAVRYGKSLGMNKPFMYNLVDTVTQIMGSFYSYLDETKEMVKKVIKLEEEKFLQTLETGEKKLHEFLNNNNEKIITKEQAFLLYDTFGFPIELTLEVCDELNAKVDLEGFKEELLKQKENSKTSRNAKVSMGAQNVELMNFKTPSIFLYDEEKLESVVTGIFKDGKSVISSSGEVTIAFDKTCFYATSGGQAKDKGFVTVNGKDFEVIDSFKLPNGQNAIAINTDEIVTVGDKLNLTLDVTTRNKTSKNHSATHLLNESLRKVLGTHVKQQGSSVTDEFLRFDFNNFTLPTDEEMLNAEKLVKEQIANQTNTNIFEMSLEEAKEKGYQALFDDKYQDNVRVCEIGFSKELCGGTHVKNTKDIGSFAILSYESKGSGIFRVECVTGSKEDVISAVQEKCAQMIQNINEIKTKITLLEKEAKAQNIKLEIKNIDETIATDSYSAIIAYRNELALYKEEIKELDKQFAREKLKKDTLDINDYTDKTVTINDKNVLVFTTENKEVNALKDLLDRLACKLDNCVIFVCNTSNDKLLFLCKNKISTLKAGMLVKLASQITKGGGGGRDDFAQAGGKDVSMKDEALNKVFEEIKNNI